MEKNQPKILIVEDEALVALDLKSRIENLECEVAGLAASGEEAIAMAREFRPQLILMDVILQGEMDGIDAAGEIRRELGIPVIYLTANADPVTVLRAEKTMPFHYLLKPIKDAELAMAIRTALHRQAAMEALSSARDALELRVNQRTAELEERNALLKAEIEKHRRTEQLLRRAQDVARAASHAKSTFLTNMSHEMRTPLNGIIGMADLLAGTPLSGEQIDYLDTIGSCARSMLAMVDDVLDLTESLECRTAVDPAVYPVREKLAELIDVHAARAKKKEIDVTCDIAPEVPDFVVGDFAHLARVCDILVSNAIKFTDHGEVDVQVDVLTESNGRICLQFSIRDTGIGIPPEKQQAIFEPFVQADASLTRRHGGAGLGLFLAVQIVELMGGAIWLDSKPGDGSTFHFTTWVEDLDASVLSLPRRPRA